MNLRERILNAVDTDRELVDVPEWGVKVEVRSMSGRDRDNLIKAHGGGDLTSVSYAEFYPMLLRFSLYDPETGERIFTAEDDALLIDKSAAVIERLAEIVRRVSGLDEKAVEEGKGG